MKNYVLAALLLTASGTYVMAQDLESKQEQRGQTGKTANPTAKPDDGGLDMKQEMRGQTGKTANPTAKPEDGGLDMKQEQRGTKK